MSLLEQPATSVGAVARGYRRRDLWSLCGVVVLLMAVVSVANLSVPQVAASGWAPTPVQLTWYVDAAVIAFACPLLPADMFGRRYGRGVLVITGLVIFAAGNLAVGTMPSMLGVIIARAIAGAGAALALPNTLALLLDRTAPERKGFVVAVWTASTSVAGVLGNGVGGLLLSLVDWRAVYLITVPIAVAFVVAVLVVVHPGTDRRRPASRTGADLDLRGMILFVVAVVALLVALIEAPAVRRAPALMIIALAVAAGAAVLFARTELRGPAPMIDLRALARSPGRAAALGIVTTFGALFVLFSLNAYLIQTVRGLPASIAGLSLIPVSIAMFVITYATVPLVRRLGVAPVVVAGMVIAAIGYLLVALAARSAPLAVHELALVIVGVGAGLCSAPLSTLLTAHRHGAAQPTVGLNSTLRELGSATGVATAGVSLSLALGASDHPISAAVVVHAVHDVLPVVAALTLLAAAAIALDLRRTPAAAASRTAD